ncbi:MAG: Holliday junction branch migration protein RuvA [Bacteroidota bacterium]
MYEFIEGEIVELTPAYVVLQAGPVAYMIQVSLNTYSQLNGRNSGRIYIHFVVKEDAHVLYGFSGREEREIFRLLISVSGVGANTARLILSSMPPYEVQQAIMSGNVVALQSIKGIGAKSAQRIIVDLRDKIGKTALKDDLILYQDNTGREEALSALVALGFPRKTVEKHLASILSKQPDLTVEEMVKAALKLM